MNAINRRAEIDFLKLMVVVNAIIATGNSIRSTLAGSDGASADAFKKSVDTLKDLLLPHWKEDTDRKAREARETLVREMTRGPLTVKVVGRDKKRSRRS